MLTKIHGIVLSVVRHNERSNVVTLYTAERGRVAFLSSASGGKSGRMRNARLAPLALIETEVNFRENRELQFLGAISSPAPWRSLYFDPSKAPFLIFLTEFLGKVLRTSEADPGVWRFLLHTLTTLDEAPEGPANFHLAFLIRFLPILGISPDASEWHPGEMFDMRTSEFTPLHPGHNDLLLPADAALMPSLLRMTFRNMNHFSFNVGQRRRLLRILIHYYSIHLPISTDLRSPDILSDLYC